MLKITKPTKQTTKTPKQITKIEQLTTEKFIPNYYVYTDGACYNNGTENAIAGIGGSLYDTWVDALNANGKKYDFSKILNQNRLSISTLGFRSDVGITESITRNIRP
jgi:hypothetical protein